MASKDQNFSGYGDSAVSEEALFFDFSPDLLAIAEINGYFKRVNPAWMKTLGYSEAELLAQPLMALVHPEDRSVTLAELERLQPDSTAMFEARCRARDGSYRWLSWTASLHPQGQEWFCVARDFTRQQETEIALGPGANRGQRSLREENAALQRQLAEATRGLEEANRRLQESEARFRGVLDHIPDVFVIYDSQRRIQVINAAGATAYLSKPLQLKKLIAKIEELLTQR